MMSACRDELVSLVEGAASRLANDDIFTNLYNKLAKMTKQYVYVTLKQVIIVNFLNCTDEDKKHEKVLYMNHIKVLYIYMNHIKVLYIYMNHIKVLYISI